MERPNHGNLHKVEVWWWPWNLARWEWRIARPLAIKHEPIGLETLKNLIALYELFETEIELWLETRRRWDNYSYCQSLRRGMAIHKVWDPSTNTLVNTDLKYTPQEFTERIYSTRSITPLLAEVSAFQPWCCWCRSSGHWGVFQNGKAHSFWGRGQWPTCGISSTWPVNILCFKFRGPEWTNKE